MPPDWLLGRIKPLPASPHAPAALQRLREAAERQGSSAVLEELLSARGAPTFLGSALGDAPFLQDLAAKDIGRLATILRSAPEERIEAEIAAIRTAEWPARSEAMAALRKARQAIALTLGLTDLAGALPLEAVTGRLSDFADAALGAALRFALAEAARTGKGAAKADGHGFFILAMGKHGAHELNYSSDIDLIALFEPAASGLPDGVEATTFWVRIVRTLVTLLQERTADGYVFRTDLRLRPDPAATPVALSAEAALLYYESMGQNWERAALIKARACAGDIPAGHAFVAEIAPFIWRKYLDFAAIADIHSIKRQVHAHRGHGVVRVGGHDIKRGRGGIREIEFFVQTQQLIAGGRDRELRGRETRATLAKLAEKGWIDEAVRAELDEAYVLLRTVEHRLQIVRDEQTHTMPQDRDELARIARLAGFADATDFESELQATLQTVARRYSELFEEAPDLSTEVGNLVFTGGEDDPDTLETLRRMGFKDPKHVTLTVRAWHFGRFAATRSTAARESLTEITPALLSALSRAGDPDAALRAFDAFLKTLPAGAQLFSILTNNPELLDLLATILGAAPRLAGEFARRPHVVDALIDPTFFGEPSNCAELRRHLGESLAEAGRHEDVLDRTRRFAAEQKFLISVGLITGKISAEDAAKSFSDLAEAVVQVLYAATLGEFERQHGTLPGGRSAVLAFGRLGSREMTAGSDLDLIILYDHDGEAEGSDGPRPLPPSQYYIRLTQRLVAALSAPTAEGVAYPVDLRLRPSGRAGPLATHVAAFERYQLNEAWTWEHMAMSRGRPVAGDPELVDHISDVLDRIVAKPRERSALAADVASMRGRIERDKAAGNAFDVKLAPGGLIDCEFAAQFLVLAGLGRIAGESTLDILRRAQEAGALDETAGAVLVGSMGFQSALLQVLRVADEKTFDPQTATDAVKRLLTTCTRGSLRQAGEPFGEGEEVSFAALTVRLRELQERTREAFERVVGAPIG